MTPPEILAAFRALPLHRRHEAMRVACSYALDVWDRYARGGEPVVYIDGVVGMRHVVDMVLPQRAIEAVDRRLAGSHVDPAAIWDAYQEPIAALQDGDLDFPDDIARAYYAIYNLFGIVFGRTQLYDDGELVILQAASGDGFVEEWWTRTWDAWASRGEVAYPPSELDAATYAALATGDLAGAIDRCPPDTRLHAVLLALAGRTDEAAAVAGRVLGVTDTAWLRAHAAQVGGTDAIAVGDRHYAAICGDRYVVRTRGAHDDVRAQGRCGFPLRRVVMSPAIVAFAGEATDDLGAYATLLAGEELDSTDDDYRSEVRGARTLAALGPKLELVAASAHEVAILAREHERLGDGRVEGAAFDARAALLVTYAGAAYTLWHRARREKLVERALPAPVWHAVFAGGRLVLALRGAPAHVVDVRRYG